jgi:integrase
MTKIRLRFIHEFVDRHGKVRRYVRLPGRPRVPLPGTPGTEAFNEAYAAAIAGAKASPAAIGARRTLSGTINAAIISYVSSSAFAALAPDTRRVRRNILERFRTEHGDKRIALLQRAHIDRMVAVKSGTPAAARNFLSAIRSVMAHCVDLGWRADDPTQGVKRPVIKSDGFRTWTEADIAAFEAQHPVGSRARLALALLLYTAQRRSDVVRLGRQHIREGLLQLRQQKTGTTLVIPVHPALAEILSTTPSDRLTFLTTAAGEPFAPSGFTNWFREMCNEVGLPRGTSAHGLRKAACRRLAEAGCSANVIAAISGHASLREVQRYTIAADQARMARSAIASMVTAFPTTRRTKDGLGRQL